MNADEKPDRHLQAALRHAPDADLQAPPALGESIVAAARAALAADRATPAPKRRWWQDLWSASPMGLGASGAFATLALGGLIALLWRGEPLPPPVVAQEKAPPPQATAAPAPAPAPEASRDVQAMKLEARRDAAPKPAPTAALQREVTRPPLVGAAQEAHTAANAVAPAPAAPAAPVVEAAPAPAAAQDMATAKAAAPAVAAAPPARQEAARMASGLMRARTPNAEDTRWLAEVDRVVRERWQPSADNSLAGARERRVGNVRVAVGAGRVLWCEDGSPPACREAALAPEQAAALLAAMPP